LWHHDKEQLPPEEKLHRLIVVEEAHRYLSEERPPSERGDRTLLELSIAEGRSYGWGFLIIDQMPLLLSRYVWDNAGTVLAHRLANVESWKAVKSALGGDPFPKDDDSERDPLMLKLPENIAIFHRYLAPETMETAVGVTLVPKVVPKSTWSQTGNSTTS
jgi:hypothetical protein